MRVVWIGGTVFGLPVLENVLVAPWLKVAGVFTRTSDQDQNPLGFDRLGFRHGFPVYYTNDINLESNRIRELNPDVLVVCGWNRLLKPVLLDEWDAIGMHPTPLPVGRGRNPVPWTIIHGLETTATSVMLLDEGADDGRILDQRYFAVAPDGDANTLYAKMVANLSRQFLRVLHDWPDIEGQRQDEHRATYWPKRTHEDCRLDLAWDADTISRHVRALVPPYQPGAYIVAGDGRKVRILKVAVE